MSITPSDSLTVSGFCRCCSSTHRLPTSSARIEAGRLSARLKKTQSIELLAPIPIGDRQLSTGPLFGDQRGKMFGVLHCLDTRAKSLYLYAFSGQFNGRWLVPGWVPPLFDVAQFQQLNNPIEKNIKELGREIASSPNGSVKEKMIIERKELSRSLMRRIHDLYRLHNFRGERRSLEQLIGSDKNLPTGVGDCCAPKLLNFAATKKYTPVSLSEFYFGKANSSGTRQHMTFYQPCSEKCQPLLGFLLCGIGEKFKQ